MLNETRPGKLESPGPEYYDTLNETFRQEGKTRFVKRVIDRVSRAVASAGIFASSIVSPIDSPRQVNAGENLLQQAGLITLHGTGSVDNLTILLVAQNGADEAMLREVKDDLFSTEQMNRFSNRIDVLGMLNAQNLCNPMAKLEDLCDWRGENNGVRNLINGVVRDGVTPHETIFVINDEQGRTGYTPILSSHISKPDIYSPSAILRSKNDSRGIGRELSAYVVLHEYHHQSLGLGHEGNDVMTGDGKLLNPAHYQFLQDFMKLAPRNYLTPENRLEITGVTALTAQSYQVREMSAVGMFYASIGTTQLSSEVIPYNDDGAGVSDYAFGSLGVHAWGETGRKIPASPQWYGLLPDMTYTWRIRASGLAEPIVDVRGNVIKDDPRWQRTEIWPGIFIPTPDVVKTFRTPKRFSDGITALTPQNNMTIDSPRPFLQWYNTDQDVFYYEVRASKDCSFNDDPDTATAHVWINLIHGGVTRPLNSWQTPELEYGTQYCWGVRPRVQGDGTPVEWSPTFNFRTPTPAGTKSAN